MKGQKKKAGGLAALKQLMPYLGRRRISLLLTLLLAAASVVLQLSVRLGDRRADGRGRLCGYGSQSRTRGGARCGLGRVHLSYESA